MKDHFVYYVYRNILAHGEDAEQELHIKGNVSQLKHLRKLIDTAIQETEEYEGYEGIGEDDVDGQYVCITAVKDGKPIRVKKPEFNPFETFGF